MTGAELKRRCRPGVKLRLLRRATGPCDEILTLAESNTVDMIFHPRVPARHRSYVLWPKAKELVETPGGFEIRRQEFVSVWEWVEETEGGPGR